MITLICDTLLIFVFGPFPVVWRLLVWFYLALLAHLRNQSSNF